MVIDLKLILQLLVLTCRFCVKIEPKCHSVYFDLPILLRYTMNTEIPEFAPMKNLYVTNIFLLKLLTGKYPGNLTVHIFVMLGGANSTVVRDSGAPHQSLGTVVQNVMQKLTNLDLRFCKNEGPKRSATTKTG